MTEKVLATTNSHSRLAWEWLVLPNVFPRFLEIPRNCGPIARPVVEQRDVAARNRGVHRALQDKTRVMGSRQSSSKEKADNTALCCG